MSQTILIADDSKTVRTIVTMAFKASGYDIVEQGEGANVLSSVQNTRPDVLILDYFFPDGDGYDICRELKENPATASLPIVMLGGSYKQFNEGLARTSGADAVLKKPFKTDALLKAVEEAKEKAQKRSFSDAAPAPSAAPSPRFGSNAGNRFGVPGGAGAPSSPTTAPASSNAPAPQSRQQASPFSPFNSGNSGSPGFAPSSSPSRNFGASPQPPAEPARTPASPQPTPFAGSPQPPQSSYAQSPQDAAPAFSEDKLRQIVQQEIEKFVRDELPSMVQNILGGPIQKKLLYKMIARADERYDEVVRAAVHTQVINEIEKLLSETN